VNQAGAFPRELHLRLTDMVALRDGYTEIQQKHRR
jgi:hypothetical protein